MAKKTVRTRVGATTSKTSKAKLKEPSIAQLSRQLDKIDCSHLVGKEVIEQQIVDLARGKLDASYCQNWERCGNGWGKCTPDNREWMRQVSRLDLDHVLTPSEIKILRGLKLTRT